MLCIHEAKLAAKGISKTALTHELGLSSRTIAKIGKGEKLSRIVLEKIADYLNCAPEELYRIISDNPILQHLRLFFSPGRCFAGIKCFLKPLRIETAILIQDTRVV